MPFFLLFRTWSWPQAKVPKLWFCPHRCQNNPYGKDPSFLSNFPERWQRNVNWIQTALLVWAQPFRCDKCATAYSISVITKSRTAIISIQIKWHCKIIFSAVSYRHALSIRPHYILLLGLFPCASFLSCIPRKQECPVSRMSCLVEEENSLQFKYGDQRSGMPKLRHRPPESETPTLQIGRILHQKS